MHTCPECGQACDCAGDGDDYDVETEEYSAEHCTHCDGTEDVDELDFEEDHEMPDMRDDEMQQDPA